MNGMESAWEEKHRMRRGYDGTVPIMYCRSCRGVSKTLTKHCIGRMLTDAEEAAIEAGTLNFKDGDWTGHHPTRRTVSQKS